MHIAHDLLDKFLKQRVLKIPNRYIVKNEWKRRIKFAKENFITLEVRDVELYEIEQLINRG